MVKRLTYDEIQQKYFNQYRCPVCNKYMALMTDSRLPFHIRQPKPFFGQKLHMCEGSYQKVEKK